jgi:GST-like protein
MQSSPQSEARAKAMTKVERVLDVFEHVLQSDQYGTGSTYSIADIAHFGWIWRSQAIKVLLANFPSVACGYSEIRARPAVATAIDKTMALAQ